MKFRTALLVVGFSLQALFGVCSAQTYPSKPVRIVVPFPPGGVADAMTRHLADRLSQAWSQPVMVENRAGANTIIAADHVVRSAPDGYTLLLGTDATVSMNQHLFRKLPYRPAEDFEPVVRVAGITGFLIASTGVNADNAAQLVAVAKTVPGKLNYASFGEGSGNWLDAENFQARFGVQLTHVPYKGVADALSGLLTDQVQLMFSSIATPLPHVRAGKLKVLGVSLPERDPHFPDIPTFSELGLTGFSTRGWFGLLAPAGTPKPAIDKIANAVAAIVNSPEFTNVQLRSQGLEPRVLMPDSFRGFLIADRAHYAHALKDVKRKPD